MHMGAALVTGGAKRLGREIALTLAARGYDIALHYNASRIDAEKTAAEIEQAGVSCTLFAADLSDIMQCEALVDSVFQAFPHVNVLVNNASIFERGELKETTLELLARHMRINFEAPVFLTQAFAERCKNGAVVNMVDARVHQKKHPYMAYLLSKKALLNFSHMAAVELAPHIRVNAVCPGFVIVFCHPRVGGDPFANRLPPTRE
ncbi:MAG: SDR family NAD(P)-dependent oxidoreductase [Alphaproteobacteria bacterium]|nr:SDR family NAD(P)-dependent oxidoreductase [Alphaproteobacteria bacterium]